MRALNGSLTLRYCAAILGTMAFMIWMAVNEETERAGMGAQALFWGVAVAAGWLQMILIARGLRASLAPLGWPGWAMLLATAVIGAAPLTFEIRWLVETIVMPRHGLPAPWITYLNVAVINLVFCLIQFSAIERWPLTGAPATEPAPAAPPPGAPDAAPSLPLVRLLSRPPEGLGGVIRYMGMEDHYLRVFTDEGEALTLHRMSDACRDLSATGGMQVHKSWWVSRAAVAEIRQQGRRRFIRTLDGADIPIGRSFEPALRDAGWF